MFKHRAHTVLFNSAELTGNNFHETQNSPRYTLLDLARTCKLQQTPVVDELPACCLKTLQLIVVNDSKAQKTSAFNKLHHLMVL